MGAVEPAEQRLMQIARGYQVSQALYVAAKLGVADVLGPQPLAAEAIAEAVGARPSPLRRVLRALVAAGVCCELEDGRFASNDAAAALRADAPGRVRDVVINFGEEMYRSFGELLHTVRTGETAFDSVYGAPCSRTTRRTRRWRRAPPPACWRAACRWLASSPRLTSCAARAPSSMSEVEWEPWWPRCASIRIAVAA
jgi:methyltransferase family protein